MGTKLASFCKLLCSGTYDALVLGRKSLQSKANAHEAEVAKIWEY